MLTRVGRLVKGFVKPLSSSSLPLATSSYSSMYAKLRSFSTQEDAFYDEVFKSKTVQLGRLSYLTDSGKFCKVLGMLNPAGLANLIDNIKMQNLNIQSLDEIATMLVKIIKQCKDSPQARAVPFDAVFKLSQTMGLLIDEKLKGYSAGIDHLPLISFLSVILRSSKDLEFQKSFLNVLGGGRLKQILSNKEHIDALNMQVFYPQLNDHLFNELLGYQHLEKIYHSTSEKDRGNLFDYLSSGNKAHFLNSIDTTDTVLAMPQCRMK